LETQLFKCWTVQQAQAWPSEVDELLEPGVCTPWSLAQEDTMDLGGHQEQECPSSACVIAWSLSAGTASYAKSWPLVEVSSGGKEDTDVWVDHLQPSTEVELGGQR